MSGSSSVRGDQTIYHTDNMCFDGTDRGSPMALDGQLWIGATASNRADNGGHVRLGSLTSPNGTIDIGYSDPNITLDYTGVNDLHVARFIVASSTGGTGANFTTIAAAIASAQGTGIPATVFIQPGTYTENFTLPANINLCAFDCDAQTPNVTIVGTITSTDAGSRTISGIGLQTNSAPFLTVSGSAATIVRLVNCVLICSNNTGISHTSTSAGSAIQMDYCRGNISTTGISLFAMTSTGSISATYSSIANTGASSTASTNSEGANIFLFCNFNFPITTSSTGGITALYSNLTPATNTTALTAGGTGSSSTMNCIFGGGSASSISIGAGATLNVLHSSLATSNTNVITGAGTLNYAQLLFHGTSSTINTTTQVPLVTANDAIKVVTPAAYPYTTTPQDAIIKVDTSSARTITPYASPTTGQVHIIKDTVGSAAANNITVTPSGKNIDGAASKVINTAYGSMTIIFTGSEWSIC